MLSPFIRAACANPTTVVGTIFCPLWGLHASALNDTNQNHNNRNDQEGMNESAHGIRADKTQNPEDN